MLIPRIDDRPGAFCEYAINRSPVDDGIGQGIVVEARRRMAHAELRFMDGFWVCGIDAPVEAEHIGRSVRL